MNKKRFGNNYHKFLGGQTRFGPNHDENAYFFSCFQTFPRQNPSYFCCIVSNKLKLKIIQLEVQVIVTEMLKKSFSGANELRFERKSLKEEYSSKKLCKLCCIVSSEPKLTEGPLNRKDLRQQHLGPFHNE